MQKRVLALAWHSLKAQARSAPLFPLLQHGIYQRGISLVLLLLMLGAAGLALPVAPAWAITAPELRGQRSLQDLEPNMHGRDLKQQEFLKAEMRGV